MYEKRYNNNHGNEINFTCKNDLILMSSDNFCMRRVC